MANKNCLEGFKCPKCGSEKQFLIEALATFDVTDDGAVHTGEGEIRWDDRNYCECRGCSFNGTVKDFKPGQSGGIRRRRLLPKKDGGK